MRLAWSYRGRMNRARYFGRMLAINLYALFLQWVAANAQPTGLVLVITFALFAILSAAVCLDLSIRYGVMRLHDMDKSGRYYWLMLLPVANVALAVMLLFRRGTKGENRFGKDPLSMTACGNCGVTYSNFHDICPMCLPKPRDEVYACHACDEIFDYSAMFQGQRCPRCKGLLRKIASLGTAKDSAVVSRFATTVKSVLEQVAHQKPDLTQVKGAVQQVQRAATEAAESLLPSS